MTNNPPTPPVARKIPREITTHGHTRVDDYYWMRDKNNPEVIAFLEAENTYTEQMTAHLEDFKEALYTEMVGRIQETDDSVPERRGNYYYYYRTEEGQQYRIHCRKKDHLEAEEEIILDINALAEGFDYFRVGILRVSPDHRLLAYSVDTSGAEDYVLRFKDLESGAHLPEELPNTSFSAEWGNDNRTFFYVTRDAAKRAHKLHRHVIGRPVAEDELLHHETDELYRVSVYKTKDDAYLIRYSGSIESGECAFLAADNPAGDFSLIHPRRKEHEYHVRHHQGTFYILTNDQAQNFKVMITPVDRPQKDHWQELIPHRPAVKVDDIELFAGHMVVYERENGLRTIRIINLETGESTPVEFPEPVYTYSTHANPEFNTHLLRYTYTSLTTPNSVYDLDMLNGTQELKKREPVLGGFDPDNYQTERIFAEARDGTKVPISLVYHRDTAINRDTPCVLYGYGSYGFSIDPSFQSNRLSFLDRGVIFAIAHIRGGQEMGRYWYDNGKFLQKKNTFTDFIACARHLIAKEYTSPLRLAIIGGSAGGLLIGAVINMAPELFHSALAAVPFVDVVTTMLDESIPLTVGEFEEWGNPQDKTYYDYMLSYSPYDNVAAQEYPHLLITSGLNDPRVQYWEPTKWTAKLREVKIGNQRLVLKTNMGAGHGGASGRYDYLRERAFEYAFLLDTLGSHE